MRTTLQMVFGLDSVHGAIYVKGATIFPHQLNAAASFNVPATQEFGRITAKDTKAAGIPWLFAPILGIAVQPGWSRVMETFGEDPYLASQLGAATVRGMQGGESGSGPLSDPQAAAACAKHYIGYSNSENGHDRAPTVIPDRHLLEYFAPPFQAAFEAGAATVMNAYTEINGETMATSHKYLTELLRDEMGFEGMVRQISPACSLSVPRCKVHWSDCSRVAADGDRLGRDQKPAWVSPHSRI